MTSILYALIPLAILATAAVLVMGIVTFARGGKFNREYSNKLMQLRILVQFVALALIALFLLLGALTPADFHRKAMVLVKLTRIYTRGGDTGETSLGDGKRVPKDDLRVASYGTTDEANGVIGLARLTTEGDADAMLSRIQNDLFDLGADLCTPEDGAPSEHALRIVDAQVDRLEAEMDAMNADLQPLSSFVLPGGSPAAAHLHLARTVVRRAERLMVDLARRETVNPSAMRYINRLSDHLFVLARYLNEKGAADILWQPGATRGT